MKRYVVVSPPSDGFDPELIAAKFPDRYEVLPGSVWVVAGRQGTCVEVCEVLGIGSGGSSGVVTKMDDYYGFYDRALWEKANEWGERQ